MSDQDPAERWRELDESTNPRARSRPPAAPEGTTGTPRPAPEPTRLRKPERGPVAETEPDPGPSPYEAYPWAAVGGSPLSPTQAPFPAPHPMSSPYGVHGPAGPPAPFPVPHPSASVALSLGIVGLVGGAACWAPVLVSPFALVIGRRALREIDASLGTLTGRGNAKVGAVLGGIGTAALVAMVLALIVYVAG